MAFRVGDKYRTNPLSNDPGGSTVVVEMNEDVKGPKKLEYDKIKNPRAYIAKIKKNPDVKDAYVKREKEKAPPDTGGEPF